MKTPNEIADLKKRTKAAKKVLEKAQMALANAINAAALNSKLTTSVAKAQLDAANAAVHALHQEQIALMTDTYRQKYPPLAPGAVTWSGILKTTQLDAKRFTLDGITVSAKCPTCGSQITRHADDYLSFPIFGEPFWIQLWCEACAKAAKREEYQGHDAAIQLTLRVEVPLVNPDTYEGTAA